MSTATVDARVADPALLGRDKAPAKEAKKVLLGDGTPAPAPPAPKLAKDLLAYLADASIGATSQQRRELIQAYVDAQPHPALVTAEQVYGHLDSIDFSYGTLRKIGRWIWDDDHFEPREKLTQHPGEELARLKGEVAQLKKMLEEQSGRCLALQAQAGLKDKLIGDLTQQNTLLRQKYTPQELALLKITA